MNGDITKHLNRKYLKPVLKNLIDDTIKFRHLIQIKWEAKILQLNQILGKKNLHILNIDSFDLQTFVGAASTSTNGTGITLPPIPDMILSLVSVPSQQELN